jgi:hypothetical protein
MGCGRCGVWNYPVRISDVNCSKTRFMPMLRESCNKLYNLTRSKPISQKPMNEFDSSLYPAESAYYKV